MHHDEWLLDDLEVVGSRRARPCSPGRPRRPWRRSSARSTTGCFTTTRSRCSATSPCWRVIRPRLRLIDDLRSRTGYDASAFRTLRIHGELDPGHGEELDELLDSLPLTREQSTVIGLSAIHTIGALTRAYGEIVL